jgi:hypothetical protein
MSVATGSATPSGPVRSERRPSESRHGTVINASTPPTPSTETSGRPAPAAARTPARLQPPLAAAQWARTTAPTRTTTTDSGTGSRPASDTGSSDTGSSATGSSDTGSSDTAAPTPAAPTPAAPTRQLRHRQLRHRHSDPQLRTPQLRHRQRHHRRRVRHHGAADGIRGQQIGTSIERRAQSAAERSGSVNKHCRRSTRTPELRGVVEPPLPTHQPSSARPQTARRPPPRAPPSCCRRVRKPFESSSTA